MNPIITKDIQAVIKNFKQTKKTQDPILPNIYKRITTNLAKNVRVEEGTLTNSTYGAIMILIPNPDKNRRKEN